jgi:hypothetical protein
MGNPRAAWRSPIYDAESAPGVADFEFPARLELCRRAKMGGCRRRRGAHPFRLDGRRSQQSFHDNAMLLRFFLERAHLLRGRGDSAASKAPEVIGHP